MCGRYATTSSPAALVDEFDVSVSPEEELAPDYNVAPTKNVYAVLERRPRASRETERAGAEQADVAERMLHVVRWGLVPSWAKDPAIGSRMINARLETAAEKPSFRRAFARRRCVLPATGYYEWYTPTEPDAPTAKSGKPKKQPYFIRPRDGSSLAMAGLYELWRDPTREDGDPRAWLWSATILTTSATDDLGRIHDRAPVLVPREQLDAWLDPELEDPGALMDSLVAAAPGLLEAYPVSTDVNNVRNNDPALLDPLPADHAP